MRYASLAFAAILAIVASILAWGAPNWATRLEHGWEGKLSSLSYAPFRRGQSPYQGSVATPEQIDEDFRLLAERAGGVRTYTSLAGLEHAPEIARRHGLKVIQSAWLSRDRAANDREIAALIDLANRYPDVIDRVIVGNEVLLRGELKPEEIVGYIRQVKAAIKQPVGYADVSDKWLYERDESDPVAAEIDFLGVHILPYWENEPQDVEHTAVFVRRVIDEVKREHPGRTILIGETGWPTAGRQRGPAVPSLTNMARFLAAFQEVARETGADYNIIEAFDQEWKSTQEGTMGANWGLFGVDRTPKLPDGGVIVDNPNWPLHCAVATLFGLAMLGWFQRYRAGWLAQSAFALAAQAVAGVLVAAFVMAWSRAYWPSRALFDAAEFALAAAYGLLLLWTLAEWLGGQPPRRPVTPLVDLGPGLARDPRGHAEQALHFLLALTAIGLTLLLVLEGRYR
ncbi:MAG TPA: glycosyl hydrolase family 17 protein, partial [Alphaproteobacteria bacterium]|nr:glycosyl hydrolase family 17 protein [Alphaproteobacteria bacterium]